VRLCVEVAAAMCPGRWLPMHTWDPMWPLPRACEVAAIVRLGAEVATPLRGVSLPRTWESWWSLLWMRIRVTIEGG
jgi:hypothetical protein